MVIGSRLVVGVSAAVFDTEADFGKGGIAVNIINVLMNRFTAKKQFHHTRALGCVATQVDFNQIDWAVHRWHLAYANETLDVMPEVPGRIYSTPHAKLASRTEEFLEAKTMLILLAVLETDADVDFAVVFLDSLDNLQDSDSFSSPLLLGLFRSDLEW